jgi:tetratricopeptide (TPR) repeat protein
MIDKRRLAVATLATLLSFLKPLIVKPEIEFSPNRRPDCLHSGPSQPLVSLFDDSPMVTALARTIGGGNHPSIAMKTPNNRKPPYISYLGSDQNGKELPKPGPRSSSHRNCLFLGENSNFVLPVSYALPLIKKEKVTPLFQLSEEDFFTTGGGHYLKGMACFIMDDFQKALFHLEQSVQINPNNSYAYYQTGLLYSKLNQYQKAVDAYNQAIQLNPNDFNAYFGLGIAYLRLNQNHQAISSLTLCTRIKPKFPDARYQLGLVYESQDFL